MLSNHAMGLLVYDAQRSVVVAPPVACAAVVGANTSILTSRTSQAVNQLKNCRILYRGYSAVELVIIMYGRYTQKLRGYEVYHIYTLFSGQRSCCLTLTRARHMTI